MTEEAPRLRRPPQHRRPADRSARQGGRRTARHPRPGRRHPRRAGQRDRRRGRRRVRHHDRVPPLGRPDVRLRHLDPARHPRRPPPVQGRGRHHHPGQGRRDVERGVRRRRPGLQPAAVRTADRDPDRPLRRRELQRLQGHGRCPRRRRGLHPEDIVDEESGITLKAGEREIRGNESLAYVRVRKGVVGGDGTDPQRIKRQQAFMASMIKKALGADMLARPDRLVGFMNATTKSLTTDFENIAKMADLAASFNGIGLDNISFVTTPWVFSTREEGRVEWTSDVSRLWRLAIEDKPLTDEFLDDAISASVDPGGGVTASDAATGTPNGEPTGAATDEATGGTSEGSDGLSEQGRAAAGLC